MPKSPKFGAKPSATKTPKIAEHVIDDGHPLAWRFCKADRAGPFAWLNTTDDKFSEIFEKLIEFENKNWNEITKGGSHPIAVPDLCQDARDRLVEIQLDDLEELLSLRLTGVNRVWCWKSGHIVMPLWWDPDHKVYPVKKDKKDRQKDRRKRG